MIYMVINNGVHDVNFGNVDEEERHDAIYKRESFNTSMGRITTIKDLTDYDI